MKEQLYFMHKINYQNFNKLFLPANLKNLYFKKAFQGANAPDLHKPWASKS